MKKQILIGVLVLLAAALVVLANPILTAISAQTVEEGQSLSFGVTTTAPDNGSTVFSLAAGAPSWASIAKVDDTSATVTLNPDFGDVSSSSISQDFDITVVAQDDDLIEDSQAFTATVTQDPLEVKDLKVDVDDNSVSGIDEDEIYEVMDIDDVYPGSEIKIEIELKNLFDEDKDDEDIDIEDIEIKATLYDIDGDDLEEDVDIDKLKPEEKETIELVFDIPEEADDDTYELEIIITGENEDTGEEYEIVLDFDVEVDKKNHDLRITKTELSPSTVSCDRVSDLDIKIKNLGKNEEDEVRVTVENSALGLSFSESDIEMDDDPDEPWTKTITIDAEGIAPGEYRIKVKVYYDDDNLDDIQDVILTVQSCAQEEEEEEPEPVEVIIPDTTDDTTDDTTEDDQIIETYEDGFFEDGITNVLLIAGILIVLILNILLLVVAFRR